MRLITLLAFLSILGLMVKIFFQDWVEAPKKDPVLRFLGLFRRRFGFFPVLPMLIKGDKNERNKRTIANVFLLIFYCSFISLIIVILFFPSIRLN